jgi:hypothetical protein
MVPDPNSARRPPRGALIVVAIGLLACVAAALLTTGRGSGEATKLEWETQRPLPDSKPVAVPGGNGERMQLTEGGIRATGTNLSGYELYRAAAVLRIDAGAPVGSARVLCSMRAPGGTEVAQTPKSRASYPRSSEELSEQPVPEVVLVEFSSHGNELGVVEFGDVFEEFSSEPGVHIEWPTYHVGVERWQWFLPPSAPQRALKLGFGTVWRTTKPPAAKIACTLTTSAGTATVRTAGALPKLSQPISEESE